MNNYGQTLYHHGVKGQKWGLRKYQNEDGSLTAAGREHYGYGTVKKVAKGIAGFASRLNNRSTNGITNKSSMPKHSTGGLTNKTTVPKNAKSEQNKKVDLDSDLETKKARQEKIKKAAIAGAAMAAGALAAYGYYKINSNKLKATIAKGTSYSKQADFQATLSTKYNDIAQYYSKKSNDSYKRAIIKDSSAYRNAMKYGNVSNKYMKRSADAFYESNRLGNIGSAYREASYKQYEKLYGKRK